MTRTDSFGAIVVARLINNQAVDGHLEKLPDPWLRIGQRILATPPNANQRTAAFEAAIAGRPDCDSLREAVFAADLEADLSLFGSNGNVPQADVVTPELPEGARLDPELGEGAGSWVDEYARYAQAVSPMTPRTFHQSAALWLAAVAIARRLVLRMPYGDVYPNLFIAWIASTTLYRKSTALTIARDVARDAFPHLLASQDTTPEAFLSDLAGQQPVNYASMPVTDQETWSTGRNFAAQRGWVLDEMSGLMSGAGKDYNAGLLESLLRFYDCDSIFTRSTRQQGRVIVRNSYLSLLGASTPAALSHHLTSERLWALGWWPRFAILTPDDHRPTWQDAQDMPRPRDLVEHLVRLYRLLPEATWPHPPESRSVALGEGVFEAWSVYNRTLSYDMLSDELPEQLWGSYGRLPTITLKVAVILAALDWQAETPCRIELPHLARAMDIAESWRGSAHRAIAGATASAFSQIGKRILRQVSRQEPDGATVRDVYRQMQDKSPAEIELAISELILAGLLEEVEPEPGRRGRPSKRYRLARD